MKQESNSQLLIFKISNQFFAINTDFIKEIIENTESFPLPIEAPHINKIIVHRNEIIAVLNTFYYFEIKINNPNYFIVLNEMIAIPADELGGIFNSNQFENREKNIKSPFVKEIFYINENPITIIDCKEISSHEGKTILFLI
ncbi:hypothetical protein TTHT_0618 [Thermotomaculum hydrothermale]|uniref:CheW-like domain-containing protein n=1 Tax=Thermotomaculum hydrothermale TaxID=981385 RepID=A0A7R6PGJ1_9BACT|nr:chemotaxis protein CheW [Thermotomaculum hydrothermale]BBB32199.1 hypothetical protein TTHT_0618 [Thermotomaculum hydrothermale]